MDPQILAALAAALNGQNGRLAAPSQAPMTTTAVTAPICEITRADGKKYLIGDCEVTRVVGGPIRMQVWKKVRYSTVLYTAECGISATGHARVVGAAKPTDQAYTPGVGGVGGAITTVDAEAADAAEAAPESPLF